MIALMAGVTDVGIGVVVPTYLAARTFLLADLIAILFALAGTWFIVNAASILRSSPFPRTDAHGSLTAGAVFTAVGWGMLAVRVIGLVVFS
jgi:hypothetical protein